MNHVIDDEEIQQRVMSIAGEGAKIIDCEKKSTLMTEEILLINGVQVKLVGEAGERIKEALKSGQTPPPELLSEVLISAGIEKHPVELETTMKVKSNTKTTELSTLRDVHGQLVDEKMKEVEEEDEFHTTSVELWERDDEKKGHKYLDLNKSTQHIIPKTSLRSAVVPNTSSASTQKKSSPQKTPSPPQKQNSSRPYNNGNVKYPTLDREPAKYGYSYYTTAPSNRIPKTSSPASSSLATSSRDNFELPVRVVYETFI